LDIITSLRLLSKIWGALQSLAADPRHSLTSAAHTAGCPGAVSAPALPQVPSVPFLQPRQRIDPQQHPAVSKELITRSRLHLHPHLANISVYRSSPTCGCSITPPWLSGSLPFLLCWLRQEKKLCTPVSGSADKALLSR
jgi:hypothetical protein